MCVGLKIGNVTRKSENCRDARNLIEEALRVEGGEGEDGNKRERDDYEDIQ